MPQNPSVPLPRQQMNLRRLSEIISQTSEDASIQENVFQSLIKRLTNNKASTGNSVGLKRSFPDPDVALYSPDKNKCVKPTAELTFREQTVQKRQKVIDCTPQTKYKPIEPIII